MANTIVKTPIVYYGGKTAILNHIMEMVPLHDVYTETFFGGGALFWAKDPARNETINDRLDIVINFYRVLRTDFKKLKQLVNATLIGRSIRNEALQLIRIHKTNPVIVDRVYLAWAFWVSTNFSFSNKIGGGYKYSNDMGTSIPQTLTNRKNEFTDLLVARIENAYIENTDALYILNSRNVQKAFHYLDPPYPNADQGHYAGYGFDEYEKLLKWCADECKGKFLLSSYNSKMLSEFIKVHGWSKKEITHRIKAPRKSGSSKVEVLVSNYSTPCGTLKLF
jgi:DNA adenine methylase